MADENRAFVSYEYKEILTDKNRLSFMMDSYENFGWEIDENVSGTGWGADSEGFRDAHQGKGVLRLKRNRKILNKMELTRLQRNFEACVREIEELERSKTSMATVYALVIGMLGTAFMAGSVFAITAEPSHIILSILLAMPAFLGWILPYFVYRRIVRKKTQKVELLIEEKYDEIYGICEKGHKLLN